MHAIKWLLRGAGLAGAGYFAAALFRYGRAKRSDDDLADQFMPDYDVCDRHAVHIAAPADVTLLAAATIDPLKPWLVRAVLRARSAILRGDAGAVEPLHVGRLVEDMTAAGWRVLAEEPGREIVLGAAAMPWAAASALRPIAPEDFAAFAERDWVKLVWTLRVDPAEDGTSTFHTELRAVATDLAARSKFRWYWAAISPAIIASRVALLPSIKATAERIAAERIAERGPIESASPPPSTL